MNVRPGGRVRCEAGEGMISGLLLIAGVLIPLLLIVPLFARLEQTHLIVAQAARDAARSAARAPDAQQADQAAREAINRAQAQTNVPLRLRQGGQFSRGAVLTAEVSATVTLGSLPGLGDIGVTRVTSRARAPVDRYRSLPPP